jgi:hypothetical protein
VRKEKTMKKLTAGFCAIALAAVPTAQAMAAPSIGTSGPKDPVVEEGTLDLKDGAKLVIKEVTPDLYEDNEVADVVENFNDEEKLTSVLEINNSLQLKLSDVQAEAPELAEGETIVVKDQGRVEYENKDVETAVKAFNEKFSTFEIHISKDGEEKTYVSTAKSLADFVKDLKEALADAGVEAETEAESESEVETETETEAVSEAESESETEAVSEVESEAETDAEDAEEETAVTNNGTEINLNDYKAMFAMADMLVDDSKALQIKETGEFKLTMTIDALKDMNAEDLLFVTTNPDDGTISFIEPDEFDAETGTITATFNHVGPFTIATKGEFEVQPQVTNKDNVILPQQYEALTSFVDLAIEDLDAISYDMDGHVQVKFTCELTVGMDEEDLALMTIDQETKEMKYLELDKFDEKTGEITVTFENLGPFVVMTKVIPDEDITVVDEEEETSEEATEAETSEAATEEATEEETSAAAEESK